MTDKRFVDDGVEEIENQSLTDNLTGRTYWIDNGLDGIVKLLNELHEENRNLKELVYSFKDIDDLNNWRQDYENQMSRENLNGSDEM